jgi:hypothetical protein
MRFEQDAQAEINELQTELQNEFQKKLFPILEQIRKEKGCVLLSAQESGAIVVEPGIDLTQEAVKRLDALVMTKPPLHPRRALRRRPHRQRRSRRRDQHPRSPGPAVLPLSVPVGGSDHRIDPASTHRRN